MTVSNPSKSLALLRPYGLGLPLVLAVLLITVLLASCGGGTNDETSNTSGSSPAVEVTLITHDSFALSDGVLEEFENQTGIRVKVLKGGDAVEIVNQAILTKSNPQGDVLFGIDTNLLTRAFDEGLFLAYQSPGLDRVDQQFQLDPESRVTPIDFGDVCINADRAWFSEHNLAIPSSLEDLAKPEYKGLLVVQDPAASTPGLAFMLATIAHFGEEGSSSAGQPAAGASSWKEYWQQLHDNNVVVTSGWEQAYFEHFSGGSGTGDRPLVVSYATSPAAEVEDPATKPEDAPTEAIGSTCYRQIEFAGILNGSKHADAAQKLIDFMLSTTFQNDIPGQMFVEPVINDATVPEAFTKFAASVETALSLPPEAIAENRDAWITEWSQIMGQ